MCVNGLQYVQNSSKVAYFAAAVGVVYDPKTHTQTFFNHHTDDITCISFHCNGVDVATGEMGKWPVCYIWDSITLEIKHKLKGNGITYGINCVKFCPDGSRLVIVDASDNHNLAIYDTKSGKCICRQLGDKSAMNDVAWETDSVFVSAGPGHFRQWTISEN